MEGWPLEPNSGVRGRKQRELAMFVADGRGAFAHGPGALVGASPRAQGFIPVVASDFSRISSAHT